MGPSELWLQSVFIVNGDVTGWSCFTVGKPLVHGMAVEEMVFEK